LKIDQKAMRKGKIRLVVPWARGDASSVKSSRWVGTHSQTSPSSVTTTSHIDHPPRSTKSSWNVYEQVLLLPSAPGKTDHGDIDFLVSGPKAGTGDVKAGEEVGKDAGKTEESVGGREANVGKGVGGVEELVGKELPAAATYRNNAMTSYATIPHPQQPNQYIQLDTHLCSPSHLPWIYFLTSYGDLVPILGATHHLLGLIINDKGLFVQLDLPHGANACGIPRNEMAVFRTLDAERMMEFMGFGCGGDIARGSRRKRRCSSGSGKGGSFGRS
jgi:hypothetical protein